MLGEGDECGLVLEDDERWVDPDSSETELWLRNTRWEERDVWCEALETCAWLIASNRSCRCWCSCIARGGSGRVGVRVRVATTDVQNAAVLDNHHDLLLNAGVALDLASEPSIVRVARSVITELLADKDNGVLQKY